jgi:VRR-NUC domain
MPARRHPEQDIQRALFEHIDRRGVPGLVAIHCPNGGWRSPIEAKILQSLGVTPGVPDVLLWFDCKAFAIELKSEAGRTTEAQLEMLNRLSEAGVFTAICHSLDRALAVLESWSLLRGSTQ